MNTPPDFPESVLNSDPQDFKDPLSNYDPPPYADELERVLCEGAIGELIQVGDFIAVSPNTTIREAIHKMIVDEHFSVLVVEGGKLVGVVSERDVLRQVAERYDQVKDRPLREVMTPEPAVVYVNDPPAKAINLMATGGFRRLPLLDENDNIVGVIGPKRTTGLLFEHV